MDATIWRQKAISHAQPRADNDDQDDDANATIRSSTNKPTRGPAYHFPKHELDTVVEEVQKAAVTPVWQDRKSTYFSIRKLEVPRWLSWAALQKEPIVSFAAGFKPSSPGLCLTARPTTHSKLARMAKLTNSSAMSNHKSIRALKIYRLHWNFSRVVVIWGLETVARRMVVVLQRERYQSHARLIVRATCQGLLRFDE